MALESYECTNCAAQFRAHPTTYLAKQGFCSPGCITRFTGISSL